MRHRRVKKSPPEFPPTFLPGRVERAADAEMEAVLAEDAAIRAALKRHE